MLECQIFSKILLETKGAFNVALDGVALTGTGSIVEGGTEETPEVPDSPDRSAVRAAYSIEADRYSGCWTESGRIGYSFPARRQSSGRTQRSYLPQSLSATAHEEYKGHHS